MNRQRRGWFIPHGLVGLWRPGDGHPNAQRGTVKDLSGLGHDGTIYGVPALYFDGAGDKAVVNTPWAVAEHRYTALRFAYKPASIPGNHVIYIRNILGTPSLQVVLADATGIVTVYADTTAGGGGTYRTATTAAAAMTTAAWNHCLLVVDAGEAKLHLWVNGVKKADGVAFNGAFDHTTFQAQTPDAQLWGQDGVDSGVCLGLLTCMAEAALASLPTDQDAKGIYDNPQGSLAGGAITWDAFYRCNEAAGATVDNGQGTAGRDLDLTGAGWDMGANLGNAAGASFSGGARAFDGVDDYVSVANHADLIFGTGDFQVHAFIKSSPAATGAIVGKGAYAGAGTGWTLKLFSTGRVQFRALDYGIYMYSDAPPTQPDYGDGALHMISVIRSAADATTRLYGDAVQLKEDAGAPGDDISDTDPLTIGQANGGEFLVGDVHLVVIGTATKTFAQAEADMKAIYEQGPYR